MKDSSVEALKLCYFNEILRIHRYDPNCKHQVSLLCLSVSEEVPSLGEKVGALKGY